MFSGPSDTWSIMILLAATQSSRLVRRVTQRPLDVTPSDKLCSVTGPLVPSLPDGMGRAGVFTV